MTNLRNKWLLTILKDYLEIRHVPTLSMAQMTLIRNETPIQNKC